MRLFLCTNSQRSLGAARDNPAAWKGGGQFGNVVGVFRQDQCSISRGAHSDHVGIGDPVAAPVRLVQDGPHELGQPLLGSDHPDALPPMASRESRLHLAGPRQPSADLGERDRRAGHAAATLGRAAEQGANTRAARGVKYVERCGVQMPVAPRTGDA